MMNPVPDFEGLPLRDAAVHDVMDVLFVIGMKEIANVYFAGIKVGFGIACKCCDLIVDEDDGVNFIVVTQVNNAGYVLGQQVKFFVAARSASWMAISVR